MLKGMFKKTTYINITSDVKREAVKPGAAAESVEVPEGLWTKCPQCGHAVYTKELEENFFVCSRCGHHLRVGARDRLKMILDADSFTPWDEELETKNPLDFPGYPEKLQKARSQTGLSEAVISGQGAISGEPVAIAVMDASFFMASMGTVVGERITRLLERATALRLPAVIYCCSGGARMQEGMLSLMQMAKTSAAIKRHGDAGLPYFTVLTDPTTGGVTASFAMLGDVILAEPGALVGFAGPRVIEQTIGQKLPKGFQRAEFLLEHGLIDAIVERKDQRSVLGRLLKWHKAPGNPKTAAQEAPAATQETPAATQETPAATQEASAAAAQEAPAAGQSGAQERRQRPEAHNTEKNKEEVPEP